MSEELKVYHAFSKTATEKKISVGEKNMPIMIADHSVVYLPMKDNNHYIVFNGASVRHPQKGIASASAISGLSITEIDLELDTKIKVLITNELDKDDGLFSKKVPVGGNEWPFEWHKKMTYNLEKLDKNKVFIKDMLIAIREAVDRVLTELLNGSDQTEKIRYFNNLKDMVSGDRIDEVASELANPKKYSKNGYYIFKVPGELLDTQPFGGFNFTDGAPASEYTSPDKFDKHIEKSFKNFSDNIYGCEIKDIIKGKSGKPNKSWGVNNFNGFIIKDIPLTGDAGDDGSNPEGFHLPSAGGLSNINESLKGNLQEILNGNDIILGDSNITGDQLNSPKLQTFAKTNKVNILISNFKILKSRAGGPFINTQIFKSEPPQPEPEPIVDGMMIIYNKSIDVNVDERALNKLIKGVNPPYRLIKGITPTRSFKTNMRVKRTHKYNPNLLKIDEVEGYGMKSRKSRKSRKPRKPKRGIKSKRGRGRVGVGSN